MKKLIGKICKYFAKVLDEVHQFDECLNAMRESRGEDEDTVECINFTKPNEKSHLTVGSGTMLDGSAFISVNYIPDGIEEQVGTQREIRDELEEPITAFRFYQVGSIDSFIEQLNWAKERLAYQEEESK